MKNLVSIALLLLALGGCKQANQSSVDTTDQSESKSEVLSIIALLEKAPTLIDQEIKVTGTVDHVCSHSGRRCFLIDSVADESIKIEAAGEIESFGKELIGSDLVVSGIVKERRLMASEIDEWEIELVEKYGDLEKGGEQCSSEMDNINSMRDWMKKQEKDYYAIYYIDGMSYEVVE